MCGRRVRRRRRRCHGSKYEYECTTYLTMTARSGERFHGKFYHRSIGVSVCVSTFHRPHVRRADLARDLSRRLVLRLRETEAGEKNKAPRPRRVRAASSRGLATVRARRLIASAAAEA